MGHPRGITHKHVASGHRYLAHYSVVADWSLTGQGANDSAVPLVIWRTAMPRVCHLLLEREVAAPVHGAKSGYGKVDVVISERWRLLIGFNVPAPDD